METKKMYDAIIVGGSVAGLSAALVLGRSMRKVMVIDSGQPCNRNTPHSHSFMTRDGATPAELTSIARQQALAYPTVSVRNDKVLSITKINDVFSAKTEQGSHLKARKILLATGVYDIMPDIEGFADCWGISVLHCPYCHGYEVKNQSLGVFIAGDHLEMYASLIQHWSKDVTLFTNGNILTSVQRDKLRSLHIPIVEVPIVRLDHNEGMLRALEMQDGTRYGVTALFAPTPTRLPGDLAQQLGCQLKEAGLIEVNPSGQTSVSGVFAAGDNSSPMRQLSMASAAGNAAGARLNFELVEDDLMELGNYN
ncbi:NAD(P)/FAD-dependent oxidoreductase [Persicitalea jodogahamensis]|uniref:Thioredoxin reductase n=1 Tax=Persicitalea jodogahamensis TaxID=402147 RepID=A0A8J3G9F5_9BACT|nr:NAD(P)/FAD-dependent oxidoreductase [Persicitalea jodogahamensis]GHB65739.1 thioredoxin reductase [Persicitalea jodogahamensis]